MVAELIAQLVLHFCAILFEKLLKLVNEKLAML